MSPPDPEPRAPRWTSVWRKAGSLGSRFHSLLLLGAGVVIAFGVMFLFDGQESTDPRLTQRDINAAVERALSQARPKPSYASVAYEVIRPSLVRIRSLGSKAEGKGEDALGTGVVIDDRGTILSSLHVVENAAEIRVTFAEGTESEASIVVIQRENDLVVLRAHEIPDDLLPATLAGSASLNVGDEIVVVGNPFGITNSVSAGVVSGKGRSIRSPKTGESLTNLIQFDAAANPGNSGGPLLNREGEVVGIVTALLNPTEQEFFIGIGFAVPIETAAAAAGAPPL